MIKVEVSKKKKQLSITEKEKANRGQIFCSVGIDI